MIHQNTRRRLLTATLGLALMANQALAAENQDATATFGEAVAAAQSGDWAKVAVLRGRVQSGPARDVVDWFRLRASRGSFGECRGFLARNADWPGLKLLRSRCELSIPRHGQPTRTLDFFNLQKPQSATGSLRLIEAHGATGRADYAEAEIRRAWLTFNMNRSEHEAFVQRHGKVIKDLHNTRLDMLLWRGSYTAAKRMQPLLDADQKRLTAARQALRENKNGVDALIKAVPKSLQNDPGLAYDRFLWRARKGRGDGAVELLLERSTSDKALGRPDIWAERRRSLARQMMRDGKPKIAYQIASFHHLKPGSSYADLEWLSGYIALRKLDDPQTAINHFKRFIDAVETPISLGRAGYWLGRAYEAAGNGAEAEKYYAFGAQYQSSFYGQLAAEKANVAPDPKMTGLESFPDWRQAKFTGSSVYVAALQLLQTGNRDLAERFLVHLAESQDRQGLGQMGNLALELSEPHIALMISKQAARQGHEIYKTYFPIAVPAGLDIPIAEDFALSIARRESEFDPVVTSPAGARGLMQLMPATAKEMATKSGEEYSSARLLLDPTYNAKLGAVFLANLSSRYQKNPVLMAVAYNAGPTRANRWSKERGMPSSRVVDVVDWIEHIPFRETRNYVMRVTESFAPYRARLSGKTQPITLSQDLKR